MIKEIIKAMIPISIVIIVITGLIVWWRVKLDM